MRISLPVYSHQLLIRTACLPPPSESFPQTRLRSLLNMHHAESPSVLAFPRNNQLVRSVHLPRFRATFASNAQVVVHLRRPCLRDRRGLPSRFPVSMRNSLSSPTGKVAKNATGRGLPGIPTRNDKERSPDLRPLPIAFIR